MQCRITNLLASRSVRSWALELNGRKPGRDPRDDGRVRLQGSICLEPLSRHEHYTADHIFVRDDLAGDWEGFRVNPEPVGRAQFDPKE